MAKGDKEVTMRQLMNQLDIDNQATFQNLAAKNIIVKRGRDQYLLLESVRNYCQHLHLAMKKGQFTLVGAPRAYDSPEQIRDKAIEYFNILIENAAMPTISGLCRHLGIHKNTLREYAAKPEFSCIIQNIRLVVEEALENRLFTSSASGAMFNLKANFGWQDKDVIEHHNIGEIVVHIPHNWRGMTTEDAIQAWNMEIDGLNQKLLEDNADGQ